MKVLGLSAFYHDSAACLVEDGRILAASQEERFTRVRFDASFPLHAIESCLAIAGIAARDVDLVAFYEKPLLRFDRTMATILETFPRSRRAFVRTGPAWMARRLRLRKLLRDELGWNGRIVYVTHHEAHAASAFLASPFDEAAILTVDGVGEWTTNAVGLGRGGDVTLQKHLVFPHSLGLFYAAVTEYLGFEVLADEYKVMGLAAYGEPRFAATIREEMIDLRADGSYRLDLRCFRFVEGERSIDPARFIEVFGAPARRPEDALQDHHADVAASAQAVLEEALLRQARYAHGVTGSSNLVLAGGVALNAVANGRLAREGPFERVWVQPAAGDAGGAVGAALLATHRIAGLARVPSPDDSMRGALLGPDVDAARALRAAEAEGLAATRLSDDALDAEVTRRLVDGEVVGWFQGRMEMGPRALGSRSILADPRRPDAQRRVNERIKFREGFRPFAPAVLEARAREFFDVQLPAPYMLFIANVAAAQRIPHEPRRGLAQTESVVSTIPAVTHVDGTARVQTVDARRHPRFHRLLENFERRSGCPLLLNTSFNLRGEPIVCTPEDAIRTFLASEMDALALGPFVIERPKGPARALPPPPPRSPTRAEIRAFARDVTVALLLAVGLASFAAFRQRSVALAAAAAVALVTAAFVTTRTQPPALLARAAAWWRPKGDVIGRVLSLLALSAVYFTVVAPIALLRRSRPGTLTTPRHEAELPSYWLDPDPPRGTPDRMY